MNKNLIIVLIITFLLLFTPILSINTQSSKIWKNKTKEPWLNIMMFANDISLKRNNNYERLRDFFQGCKTPKDFYNRIQEKVNESKNFRDYDLPLNELFLTKIVDTIQDGNATLYCHQQSVLYAAGVKAMHSHYDNKLHRYILDEKYENFEIEIWRSFDFNPPILYPWRSHIQVVINIWNGTESFSINNRTFDKLEVDTFENEYREFNKRNEGLFHFFFPAKLNSVLKIRNTLFL